MDYGPNLDVANEGFNSAPTIKDGIKYYNINEGALLYQSDRHHPEGVHEIPNDRIGFFALSQAVSEQYGVAYSYVTQEPYELIAIDNNNNLKWLTDIARSKNNRTIERILKVNYGCNYDGEEIGNRVSFGKDDWLFVQFLCSIGVTGYALNYMTTDAGGVFHKEIVICEPNVTLVGRVSNTAVEKLHKDRKLQDAIKPNKAKRNEKNFTSFNGIESSPGRVLDFGNEFSPARVLDFGNEFSPARVLGFGNESSPGRVESSSGILLDFDGVDLSPVKRFKYGTDEQNLGGKKTKRRKPRRNKRSKKSRHNRNK